MKLIKDDNCFSAICFNTSISRRGGAPATGERKWGLAGSWLGFSERRQGEEGLPRQHLIRAVGGRRRSQFRHPLEEGKCHHHRTGKDIQPNPSFSLCILFLFTFEIRLSQSANTMTTQPLRSLPTSSPKQLAKMSRVRRQLGGWQLQRPQLADDLTVLTASMS